jgi:hypothetical protein
VAETRVKRLLCCGFRRDGTSVSMLVQGMSRNKCFSQVQISHVLRFTSICDLLTDSPSYDMFRPLCDHHQARPYDTQDGVLYMLPPVVIVIRTIKSRRMRWTGHVARTGRKEMHIGYWWESQKGSNHYEDKDVGGCIILKWILER